MRGGGGHHTRGRPAVNALGLGYAMARLHGTSNVLERAEMQMVSGNSCLSCRCRIADRPVWQSRSAANARRFGAPIAEQASWVCRRGHICGHRPGDRLLRVRWVPFAAERRRAVPCPAPVAALSLVSHARVPASKRPGEHWLTRTRWGLRDAENAYRSVTNSPSDTPACRKMLRTNPGASVSPACTGTVTRPSP